MDFKLFCDDFGASEVVNKQFAGWVLHFISATPEDNRNLLIQDAVSTGIMIDIGILASVHEWFPSIKPHKSMLLAAVLQYQTDRMLDNALPAPMKPRDARMNQVV